MLALAQLHEDYGILQEHEPSTPTDAWRNLGPNRVCELVNIFAGGFVDGGERVDGTLMEMRWMSLAFAASLESSEDQGPMVRMRSFLHISAIS